MRRLIFVIGLVLVLSLSLSMTSCGGSGSGGSTDLVLLSFNYPNIAGVVLNAPLIFVFSNNIAPTSITPDTLGVVGARAPFFETTVVDGNLVALLPAMPNFADYSDAGFAPSTTYSVSMAVFPAPSTIETPAGNPLLQAESFTFQTVPGPIFMEHARPIRHGLPPSQGGRSDDEGCLQNSDNVLYSGIFQSSGGTTLICEMNEGAPRAINSSIPNEGSRPFHDERAVGTPSSVTPGLIDMPAVRVKFNEALDPLSVVPYIPTSQLSVNVQLWRVAQKDGTELSSIEQIQTNEPRIIQSLSSVEIILVPSGPVPQGIYCVVARPALRDLAQNSLRIDDDPNPADGGYQDYDDNPDLPQGWRLYFRSLTVPNTPQAISETFSSNAAEWGDIDSDITEPGVFTQSVGTTMPMEDIPGLGGTASAPSFTLVRSNSDCGQSTSGNWNDGYRFLNLDGVKANIVSGGADLLRPTWLPYLATGDDGNFISGESVTVDSDTGSNNGDGVYEYEEFHLEAGDTLSVTGGRPLLIICQGDFTVDEGATISLAGKLGGPGLDTDGTSLYTNPGGIPNGGPGGGGGAGASSGGRGHDPIQDANMGNGFKAGPPENLFETLSNDGGLGGVANGTVSEGGGGGGFGTDGGDGVTSSSGAASNKGDSFGTATFLRDLDKFKPDRGYWPNAGIVGGTGGGGGSLKDDGSGVVGNGDAGGGGGGGGGGSLWVICGGTITINGTIDASGGDGGSGYSAAQQIIDVGPDGDPNTGDEFISGVLDGVTPAGAGGPGGGGSGGGILLIAMDDIVVSDPNPLVLPVGGQLLAQGGAGGTTTASSVAGGGGGDGRITLMLFDGSGGAITTTDSTIDPAAEAATDWVPTITENSVGQAEWVDLAAPNADFDPGGNNPPSFNSNFAFLEDPMFGNKDGPSGGATDFDAIWEFQGADELIPNITTPTSTVGLTAWDADVNVLDSKRFIRWRFRFFVKDDWGNLLILPAIEELLIPYENN